MRGLAIIVGIGACGFSPSLSTAPPIDSPTRIDIDAPPMIDAAPDPCAGTLLCLTFDPNPLPATLPNGGSAPVSAMLTAVTWIQGVTGGAVQMTSSSQIYVPSVPQLSGVLALDYWVRIDQPPALYGRYGIMDSQNANGVDSFYYVETEGPAVRCYLNSYTLLATVQPFSGWTHVACSCDPPNLSLYVNGTLVMTQDEQCSAAATDASDGIEIGADNTGIQGYTDDILDGALDDVRLYNAPLTATQVCKLAGTC